MLFWVAKNHERHVCVNNLGLAIRWEHNAIGDVRIVSKTRSWQTNGINDAKSPSRATVDRGITRGEKSRRELQTP